MRSPVLAAWLLLSVPGVVVAQGGDAKPPAAQQDPDGIYSELARAFDKAMSDWQDEIRAKFEAAQKSGQKEMPAIDTTPPSRPFFAKALQHAKEFAGTEVAMKFLLFVCKNSAGERDELQLALQGLTADHAGREAIGESLAHLEAAALYYGAAEPVFALLDAVLEKNRNESCQAQALLLRGSWRVRGGKDAAEVAKGKQDLLRLAEVTKDEAVLAEAKAALFEAENLQVGCKAPEIVAKDTDGQEMKLSDYRGKVVLLDFWGFW